MTICTHVTSALLLASGFALIGCAHHRETTGPDYNYYGVPADQRTSQNYGVYGDPGNMGANGVGGSNAGPMRLGGPSKVGNSGPQTAGTTGRTLNTPTSAPPASPGTGGASDVGNLGAGSGGTTGSTRDNSSGR